MKIIKNKRLPGIGMRIWKSAIAVALCFVVNRCRGGEGILFYSLLAALWCIQMYRSNTRKNAIQRTIGTCVGAVYGLIYLLIYPVLAGDVNDVETLKMMLISGSIVFVLYTTVLLKKKQASYFSCVVFLSIAVNHVNDLNPYIFVWNRFLDTLVGIGIGVLVNDLSPCLHPDTDALFVSGIDDILVDEKDHMSPFSKVELNRMIDRGLHFTVATMRTPASVIELMQEIHIKHPIIAMDGAVLYDIKNRRYILNQVLPQDASREIQRMVREQEVCWYANVVIDNNLIIFYEEKEDLVNKEMVEKLRLSPYRNYIKRLPDQREEITYFMILEKTERAEAFYRMLEERGYTDRLKIRYYPSHDYAGYSYIKIYNRNASKESMLEYLKKETGIKRSITFGTIPDQYDVLIQSTNLNEMVRKVRQRFEPLLQNFPI